MSDRAGKTAPEDDPIFHYGITSRGVVLGNLRFWPATIIGVALLVLAYVNAGAGNSEGIIFIVLWATFTVLWIVWSMVMPLITLHPGARVPPRGGVAAKLPAATPEQAKSWAAGKPTPLRPAQQAWVDMQVARSEATATSDEEWAKLRKEVESARDTTVSQPATRAKGSAAAKPASPKKPAAAKKAASTKKPPAPPRPPAPEPQPYGVDHWGAERLAAAWMKHLWVLDADETRYSQDGGIDVESAQFVAQVKHLTGVVGAPDVQQLAGVALVAGKHAVFFAQSGYSLQALDFADQAGVALFCYDARLGTLEGENKLGWDAIAKGSLPEVFAPPKAARNGRKAPTPRA